MIRVLLIEDNPADAQIVMDMLALAAERYEVTAVGRLGDGLAALAAAPYDVCLLDLGLPDVAGLTALATIRAAAPVLAVIVLSGMRDRQVAISALESGAQDFLVKGRIDDDVVQRSIRYALARRDADEARWRLAAIVESTDDAIIGKHADGTITSWNPGAESLYGYGANEAIGLPIAIIIPPERVGEESEILARVVAGQRLEHYETRRMRRDGTLVDVSLTVSPIIDSGGRVVGASTIARDISDRKRLERELQHRADHDHLTGLFNRGRFEQELARHIAMCHRYGPSGALLSLDVDDLKSVNDAHGHAAGDALLRRTADVLRSRLRGTDVIARVGGDEFAVLLPRAEKDEATGIAGELLELMRTAGGGTILTAGHTTASIGVVAITAALDTIDHVMRRADEALYRAKRNGRDRLEFDAALDAAAG